ncbi:FAD-dependent oxidoreductase [Azorhizobium caulinodans]|uniref:FAD-dependent oxidoreductase n=1 Tax=Azorhizobium caulinodans TaxID=7 RepID=UPI002FBD4644
MPPRDIAIAGCGPAGLAAALLLHRDAHRVVLYERFETARPVGSGLMIQPTGRAVLRALGLEATIAAAGAPIERLFGLSEPSGRAVLDVRYDALGADAPRGIGIHRAALFHTLHEAVRAEGIPVFTGRPISTSVRTADGRRHLVFADGTHSAPVDLVVDALGTSSPLAPPTGRPLPYGALWATLDWVDALASTRRRWSSAMCARAVWWAFCPSAVRHLTGRASWPSSGLFAPTIWRRGDRPGSPAGRPRR